MKYNLALPIISIFGEPLKENPSSEKVITFRDAAITALLNYPSEVAAEKLAAWDLACNIRDNPEDCELTSENVTLLKKTVDKLYGVAVYGPFIHLLEQKVTPVKIAAE